MQNYRLTIQYDGTDYQGWQIQPGARTIQGELTRVLSLLDHRPVTLHGAGRTDGGVHAEGQVASVILEREFEPNELRDAINGNLERDLRVALVEFVEESFHARFSAKSKTYRYRIWTGHVVSPFDYRYVYHYRGQLDVGAMKAASASLVGWHDFSAFTVRNSESEDHVRTVTRLDVEQTDREIHVIVEADGFLRFMVRTIVGTLLEVGRNRISASDMSAILANANRDKAGPTAPAQGLTLVRIGY